MATWKKKLHQYARLESQRRWRAKNRPTLTSHDFPTKKKPVLDRKTYWIQRRLQNLINEGIIIPEIDKEIEK